MIIRETTTVEKLIASQSHHWVDWMHNAVCNLAPTDLVHTVVHATRSGNRYLVKITAA